MKIYLFTSSFPFGNQETFLEYELAVLAKTEGLNITLVPREVSAVRRELPKNVQVDTSYSDLVRKRSEKKIWPVLIRFSSILQAIIEHGHFSLSAIRDVSSFVHYGTNVLKWSSEHLNGDELLYTYWNDVETYGLSLFKRKKMAQAILISRAHRFDLYEESRPHGFIPFRKDVLNQIDQVFCISNFGVEYLKNSHRYTHTSISYLGVFEPRELPHKASSDLIVIVSCSSLVKVKRIPFIISSICFLAEQQADQKFQWTHFGGSKDAIANMLPKTLPENLIIDFKGQKRNVEVRDYYGSNYVDVFINLSSSEGIPVSIMEAMSYSIPVVATSVGGVSEIVDGGNGFLLDPEPVEQDVADAVISVVSDVSKRNNARRTFLEKFNAQKNYEDFVQSLRIIYNHMT